MDNYNDSVMIALLPTSTDWCTLELPHVTLVYAGLVKDRKITDFNEIGKDTAALAMTNRKFGLAVMGVSTYGSEEKVDALKLRPSPQLLSMRRLVERWNASEHSFSPHATIGPVGSLTVPTPKFLFFDRLIVTWGDSSMTMSLQD